MDWCCITHVLGQIWSRTFLKFGRNGCPGCTGKKVLRNRSGPRKKTQSAKIQSPYLRWLDPLSMPNYPNMTSTIPHIEIERNRSILHTPYLSSIKCPTHPQAGILPCQGNCRGMASSSTMKSNALLWVNGTLTKKTNISTPLQEPGLPTQTNNFSIYFGAESCCGVWHVGEAISCSG